MICEICEENKSEYTCDVCIKLVCKDCYKFYKKDKMYVCKKCIARNSRLRSNTK